MTLRYRENPLRQQSNGIKSRKSGFTLIEVMVALAVFAVVGLALTKNASLAVVQTTRMQEQLLASMVAQNVLRERLLVAAKKILSLGRTANSKRFRWLIGDTKSLLEVKPPTMMM